MNGSQGPSSPEYDSFRHSVVHHNDDELQIDKCQKLWKHIHKRALRGARKLKHVAGKKEIKNSTSETMKHKANQPMDSPCETNSDSEGLEAM
ncbi:hypothetical protein B9Z55_018825 [Caenorhabditis nigoni]|nr:hypothetical protein B9Z55_018825 [Caenorhabditis nigoni]